MGPTNEFQPSMVFETGEFERPKFDCTYKFIKFLFLFSELFFPQQYIPLLTADIYLTLSKVNKCIRWSQDCSLEFISRLVGKLCLSGHAGKEYRPESEILLI